MRLTKIYTKVGDKGTTLLANGARVSKHSLRIETYGTVDELNAVTGILRDQVLSIGSLAKLFNEALLRIQNELFDIGGELATPIEVLDISKQQVVNERSIHRLEQEIDQYNGVLPPLENFVLPGGHPANSAAHLARTVCRRAERLLTALGEEESARDEPRIYLNRLSDWFFVAARTISHTLECPEILWQQNKKSP